MAVVAQITPQTAPRTHAELAALGNYQRKALAKALGLTEQPPQFAAFVALDNNAQAVQLFDALNRQLGPAGAPTGTGAPPPSVMNAGATAPAEAPRRTPSHTARRGAAAAAAGAPAAGSPVAPPGETGGVEFSTGDKLRILADLASLSTANAKLAEVVKEQGATIARLEGGQRALLGGLQRFTTAFLIFCESQGIEAPGLVADALATPTTDADALLSGKTG